MDGPWFRRWCGFGYRPISRQGWLATIICMSVSVPFGVLFLMLADSNPIWSWISGAVGFASVFVFHAIVVWKLERYYGS